MNEKILKKLDLENNLCVTIYDNSKKLIGDRYKVIFVAKMEISITKTIVKNKDQGFENVQNIIELLGDKIIFEQKREKIFVDEKEKEGLLKSMVDSFIIDMIPYLSRPDFAIKFIEKQYKAKLIKQSQPKVH